MKTKQLLDIALKIGRIKNSYIPGTMSEVAAQIEAAASHCKSRREAARVIAEEFDGFSQAVLEGDFRFPAQYLLGA